MLPSLHKNPIVQWVKTLLLTVQHDDVDTRRRGRNVISLALGLIVISFMFLPEVLAESVDQPQELVIFGISVVCLIGIIVMARRGWVRLASLSIITLIILILLGQTLLASIIDLSIFLLCLSILAASVTLRSWDVGIVTGICCAGLLALTVLMVDAPFETVTGNEVLRIGALVCLACGMLSAIGTRSVEYSLRKAKQAQEQAERALAERDKANRQLEHKVAERTAELLESQALLRGLIDNAPAPIFIKDLQDRFLVVNQHYAAMCEHDVQQIVGRFTRDLFPPEVVALQHQDEQDILSTGKPHITEQTVTIADTQRTYVNVVFPIYDDPETVIAIGGIATDITERKHAEEAYHTIVEHSLQGLSIFQDGRCVFANPMISTISGYTAEEIYQVSPVDLGRFVFDEDRERILQNLRDRMAGKPVPQHYEYRIVRKDGTIRWVEQFATVIQYRGRPAVQAAYLDITERKRAEEALRTSEARFRAVWETAADAMVLSDADGIVVLANPAYYQLYGLTESAILGQHFAQIFPESEQVQAIQGYQQTFQTAPSGQRFELDMLHANGSTLTVEARIDFLYDEDRRTAMLSVIRDMTERKRMEEDLRTNEARYVLASKAGNVGVWDLDLGKNMIHLDPNLKAMIGCADHEILNHLDDWIAHVHPDDIALVKAELEAHLCGTRPYYECEHRMLHKDGSVRWMLNRGNVIGDETGTPQRMLGTATDITERKQREEQLRLLESVAVHTNDGVLITETRPLDEPGPRIMYTNASFLRMTGYSEEEVLGKTPRIFQGPQTDRAKLDQIRHALEQYQPIRVELLNYRKDGSEFWVELDISTVTDTKGQHTHFVAIQRDATERKQIETALRDSRTLLYSIIDNAPAIIFARDLQGQFTLVNQPFCKSLGLEHPEQILSKTISDFFPPAIVAKAHTDQEQLLATGTIVQREEFYDTDRGKRAWLSSLFPIYESTGAITALGAISTDITHIKQTEANLLATTSRLTTLIESLQSGILVEDEMRRIVVVNQTFCSMFGIAAPPQELIGFDCAQTAETFKELFRETERFSPRIAEILSAQRPVVAEVLRLADGRTFERDYVPIVVDSKYRGHLWQYRDITERKRAEESLRRSTERLQALYDIAQVTLTAQSPVAIAQAALQHLYQLVPCPTASVIVFDFATGLGKPIAIRNKDTIITPETMQLPFNQFAEVNRVLEQGTIHVTEDLGSLNFPEPLERRFRALGVHTFVTLPLRIQGTLIGVLNLGFDHPVWRRADHQAIASEVATFLAIAIHQARLHEQTRQDAETKTTLLREVNHRVKNNLSAIIGLLYAEQRRAGMEHQAVYQAIITELVSRVQSLATVHNLLSASAWRPVQLSELAHHIAHLAIRALPPETPVVIDIENSPVLVTPDQAHNLALVMNELATNAIKYARNGTDTPLHIAVGVTLIDQSIRLAFRDNGPGYPDAVLLQDLKHLHVGFNLIRNIVRRSLHGEITLLNDGGAVATITFADKVPTV